MTETVASSFTPQQMWAMFHRSSNVWGIPGYDLPREHFDHKTHALNEKNFSISIGKAKRDKQADINKDAKRGDFLEQIIKVTQPLPPPWSYDVRTQLGKTKTAGESVPRKMLSLMYKWKNTPDDKQDFSDPKRTKGPPLNMSVKKDTYIDHIIRENTKENYPRPGPSNYFMDEKDVKLFGGEHADLLAMPAKKEKKDTLASFKQKGEENICFFNERESGSDDPCPGLLPKRCWIIRKRTRKNLTKTF